MRRAPVTALLVGSMLLHPSDVAATERLRLPAPRYPAVVQLLDAGRAADALASLDRDLRGIDVGGVPMEARILRARLLTSLGRDDEGYRAWTAVGEDEPSLRAYVLTTLIAALVDRREVDAADEHLTTLTRGRPGREHLDLLVSVADAHRGQGALDRAQALYEQALRRRTTGGSADRARLGLAATREDAGDAAGALELYRQTQQRYRTVEAFTDARSAARRLAATLGQPADRLTETHYRDLVRRLRGDSRYQLALDLLADWSEAFPNAPQADVIDLERIETLYAMRDNDEAIRACAEFVERYPTHEQLPSVRLVRFRLAVRLGRTDEVQRLGGDLWNGRVAGTSSSIRRSTGMLLAAYLVAVGDVEAGLDVYRPLFRASRGADDQRSILWRAGVAAVRAGQYDRAVTNLRGLVRRRPTGELAPAAQYWLGVAEQRLGRSDEANRLFRALERGYPYHYYGIRAAERLAAASAPADPRPRALQTFPDLALARATRDDRDFTAATLLAGAGLRADAAEHAWRLLGRRRRDKALALVTARALAEVGEYSRVSTILTNHFGEFLRRPAGRLPDDFWRLVYPRPYLAEVRAASEANGVDPLLLYSLMRQESRFDPNARSSVGALGLFQIMPYTASEIGPAAGVGDVSDDEAALLQPHLNAAIGAKLMNDLLALFDATIAPVAASYNAGEDLVALWWTAAEGLAEDEFVDGIPYSQTRGFVRQVLTNYAAYRRLYGNTDQ